MTNQNERDDLDQLLASAGWLRVVERARQDWKDGYPAKIKMAIAEAREKGTDLAAAVQMVDYASDEVNKLLSWPRERLARLQQPETRTTLTRGGYDTQAPR